MEKRKKFGIRGKDWVREKNKIKRYWRNRKRERKRERKGKGEKGVKRKKERKKRR